LTRDLLETSLAKWARTATILVVILVTGAVLFSYYRRTHLFSRTETPPGSKLLPENVTVATQGFSFSQSERGRTTLEVTAKVNLGFKDNKNLYESVTVRVLGREGNRYDTISSQRCEYDQTRQEILFLGNVVVRLSDIGNRAAAAPANTLNTSVTVLNLDRLKYSHQTRRAETDGLVRFSRGLIHGSALGLTYDTQTGSINLHSQVEIQADPSKPGDSVVELSCGSLKYSKMASQVELQSKVRVIKGLQEVQAGRILASLHPDDSSLRQIEASDSVETYSRDPEHSLKMHAQYVTYVMDKRGRWVERILAREDVRTQSLDPLVKRTVTAAAMQFFFRPQSSLLSFINADGKVHCVFSDVPPNAANSVSRASEYSPGDKVIDAPAMRVLFKPDGKQTSRIEAIGPSIIREFPLQPKDDKKVLTARGFKFLFAEKANVLDKFTADSQVTVELQPPSGPPRKTFSDHLVALMDGQTRQIRELQQSGRFRFLEADRAASSEEARYFAAEERIILQGRSSVRDHRSRTTAEVIEMFRTQNLVKARGSVRSVFFEQDGESKPGMFQPEAPVFASSDFMESETQRDTAKYFGQAKLWQEDQILRADQIWLFRKERKLVAEKNVSSLLHLQKVSTASAPKSDPQPVSIQADKLTYEDQLQRIFYETNVRAQSPMGKMTARQLEVFLITEGKQTFVGRMLAKGNVRLQQATRTSYSDNAEYFRQEDRLVLLGGPPRIIDSERGFTSGARLTMYLNDDRISVEGDSEIRSVTRQDVAR
jgi:LPS export ABC transporter protein LptC